AFSRAAATVRIMLVPVSPSGTGKTLSPLMRSSSRRRYARAPATICTASSPVNLDKKVHPHGANFFHHSANQARLKGELGHKLQSMFARFVLEAQRRADAEEGAAHL